MADFFKLSFVDFYLLFLYLGDIKRMKFLLKKGFSNGLRVPARSPASPPHPSFDSSVSLNQKVFLAQIPAFHHNPIMKFI